MKNIFNFIGYMAVGLSLGQLGHEHPFFWVGLGGITLVIISHHIEILWNARKTIKAMSNKDEPVGVNEVGTSQEEIEGGS